MANVFLNGADRDVETAIMLEQAIVHDIGKAVAYTDGDRVFINTDDNLYDILPAYDHRMLKWLLWHERMHKELKHHNRFFKYLKELDEDDTVKEFQVSKEEVNIIMDILVHDWMAKKFPDLVEVAASNLAQLRNRNSLGFTFETFTLEEMLEEYRAHKKGEGEDGEGEGEGEGMGDEKSDDTKEGDKDSKEMGDSKTDHGESGDDAPTTDSKKDDIDEKGEAEKEHAPAKPEPEHDKTDWSKLGDIDPKEFISKEDSEEIIKQVNRLKKKKFRIEKLTETLNGLSSVKRTRTYSMPSYIQAGPGVMLKGSKPGQAKLYLCFDASGSMGSQMDLFKEIIGKSIPQAMQTTTTWFSGRAPRDIEDKCEWTECRKYDYYKGTFKDFMQVYATSGYSDDGDRTIELCWLAEQQGYTPIGITDGGGQLNWSKDKLKQLKRTVLVGQSEWWLKEVKKINPRVQTLHI